MSNTPLDDAALENLASFVRGGAQPTAGTLLALIAELRRLREQVRFLEMTDRQAGNRIGELRTEVGALREDRERLDWLQNAAVEDDHEMCLTIGVSQEGLTIDNGMYARLGAASLRAAIDAARKREEG